jgi:ABC-2 type transport system ATP-binding protein
MEEQQAAGRGIIMSTHQMHQVEALCSRIVLINRGAAVLYGDVAQLKREFAGNAVILEGQGEFETLPGVLEARRRNGTWHLALEPGTSPQALFQILAERKAEIERFEIAAPSLDDIFIIMVRGGTEVEDA